MRSFSNQIRRIIGIDSNDITGPDVLDTLSHNYEFLVAMPGVAAFSYLPGAEHYSLTRLCCALKSRLLT